MEVLTLTLQKDVSNSLHFRYHHRCSKHKIINVCFADDLFIFARGDSGSIHLLMNSLDAFKSMSGLVPNPSKSTVYFCNVPQQTQSLILSCLPFDVGRLPVKYLGVPLISSRLRFSECKILLDRLDVRINDWRNKTLSFAGRLQLIRSVLSAMHIFWAAVFILPRRTIQAIEDKLRGFLWCNGPLKRGHAKVKWSDVCMPRDEGGLGIRRIEDMNNALMAFHLWSLISNRESLWVRWIHTYRLKGRSVWTVKVQQNISWTWRKLLQIRPLLANHVWWEIGNGQSVSVWMDRWHQTCPLKSFISPRMIASEGLSINATVKDLIVQGEWNWPVAWYDLFPVLNQLPTIHLTEDPDKLVWKDLNGQLHPFSTMQVWESIRKRSVQTPWWQVVWYSQCIPRHSFVLWLAIKRKLRTQDKLIAWDRAKGGCNLFCCMLCYAKEDSHEHLFFDCPFSKATWSMVCQNSCMQTVTGHWDNIMDWVTRFAKSKSAPHVVAKLLLSASVYYLWQERNNRLFNRPTRSHSRVADQIIETVRMKLLSIKFRSSRIHSLLWNWQLPRGLIIYDDQYD